MIAVSAGPARVTQALREALARGADRAIHVDGEALARADASVVGKSLAAALKDEAVDLVLTGLQSDDQGFAQVGVILAEALGLSHATIVMEVQVDGAALRVRRELEGGWFQWVAMPLPALLTIQSGINQLRYATLKGIMAAKKKEIRVVAGPGRPDAAGRDPRRWPCPPKQKQTRLIAGAPRRGRARAGARPARGRARPRGRRDDPRHRRTEGRRAQPRVVGSHRGGAGRSGGPITDGACSAAAATAAVADAGGARSVDAVLAVDHAALASYTADAYTARHRRAGARREAPAAGHRGAHLPGPRRHAARRGAARSRRSSPTRRRDSRDRRPVFKRPMFQAKLVADVVPARADAALRHRADRRVPRRRRRQRGDAPAPIVAADRADRRRSPSASSPSRRSAKRSRRSISRRRARIVSVGRGIKGEEHIQLAKDLAAALGAELAASRPISTPAGCRSIARSAAPARPSRRSSISRSASPAPSSTSSA